MGGIKLAISNTKEVIKQRWNAIIDRLPKDREIQGAEIGVWRGGLSAKLLEGLPNLTLYMVDRWKCPDQDDSYANSGARISTLQQREFDISREMATNRTKPYKDRIEILVGESSEVSKRFMDGQLDFVFIDADHSYDGVMKDLKSWVNTVKIGGWLCGHDWDHPDQGEVKRAVLDFIPSENHDKIEVSYGRTWFYKITEAMK